MTWTDGLTFEKAITSEEKGQRRKDFRHVSIVIVSLPGVLGNQQLFPRKVRSLLEQNEHSGKFAQRQGVMLLPH